MTRQQELRWVVVPNGLDGATARLSVFIAPQLGVSDGAEAEGLTLAAYPDLVDWPTTLSGQVQLAVEIEGATPVSVTLPSAEPAVWAALFDGRTTVEPFVADDPTQHAVATYDAATIVDTLCAGYSAAALAVPALEPNPWDADAWRPEVWEPGLPPGSEQVPVIPGQQPPVLDVGELFPAVVEALTLPINDALVGPVAEFNELLTERGNASVGGMLFDDPGSEADTWSHFAFTNHVLRSYSEQDAARRTTFRTDAERSEQRANLAHAFDLHHVLAALGDHPALLRALGLVLDVVIPAEALPSTGRLRAVVAWAGPPTSASRVDHTPWTVFQRDDADGFTATPRAGGRPGLVRLDEGYRVEQLDLEGAAHAIHALAQGAPASGRPALPPLRTVGLRLLHKERGKALVNAAQTVNGNRSVADAELYADDLVRGHRIDVFDGRKWRSLHARVVTYLAGNIPILAGVADEGMCHARYLSRPREPGQSLTTGDVIVVGDVVVTWDGWSLAAARPGRAISADPLQREPVDHPTEALAESGLRVDVAVRPGSLPRLRFGRTYQMRMRTVDVAGNGLTLEAADDRTGADAGLSTAAAVFRRYEPVPPPEITHWISPGPHNGENERRMAVRSGFDDGDLNASGAGVALRQLFPPKCSVQLAELHAAFDAAMSPSGRSARAETYRLAARESNVLGAGESETPYLPDPQSSGVCFAGLPGQDTGETLIMAWPPDRRPITVRLVAGQTTRPVVDAATGIVTVSLPPAARAAVQVSSTIADPELMALLAWCRERLDADELATVEADLRAHRHSLFSPPITLELVHAVQRPLVGPDPLAVPGLEPRVAGQTHSRYVGPFTVDPASTASIELLASWQEGADEILAPTESILGDEEPILLAWPGDVSDGYQPRRTFMATALGARVEIARDVSPALAAFYANGSQHMPPLEHGDTKHRQVTFVARATSRFAEFFPPSYAGDPRTRTPSRLTRDGAATTVSVPSTRPPPAPDVIEVLPLLRRVHNGTTVVQEGGWLRVWLARPWYASGDEENFGVLIADRQPGRPHEPAYAMATLAALDPARSFPDFADAAYDGLTPRALSGWFVEPARVSPAPGVDLWLALYLVNYDHHRDAWYADVRVAVPNGYFPFVRLAVARWQPNALDDCHLSAVVALDPVQVLPDRTLTVEQSAGSVALTLTGPSYGALLGFAGVSVPSWEGDARVTVRIQTRVRPAADDLLAWDTVAERRMEPLLEFAPYLDLNTVFAVGPPDGRDWRLLVIEEDFAPSGTYPDQSGLIPRVVFAHAVPVPGPVS